MSSAGDIGKWFRHTDRAGGECGDHRLVDRGCGLLDGLVDRLRPRRSRRTERDRPAGARRTLRTEHRQHRDDIDDAVAALQPAPSDARGRRSSAFVRERHGAPSMHVAGRLCPDRRLRPTAGMRCRTVFQRCNISTKETNDRGENHHEGDRGNGPGCGTAGMKLVERPSAGSENDVVVRFMPSASSGLSWRGPSTWTDRLDRDRTPSSWARAGQWSPPSAMARGAVVGQRCRPHGLASRRHPGSMWPSRHATLAPLPGDVVDSRWREPCRSRA